MFVTVNLALAQDVHAVVVPKEALYRVAGLTKVFTVRDGRAVENRVTPGREVDGMVEVQSGKVQAGDSVAVSKLAMLTEGTPVAVASR
jgi:multidrug efflux pump subunit AcrA (membrane-fusion protein)